MKKVIIIKYGELSTKSDNINFFIKTLKNVIGYLLLLSLVSPYSKFGAQ